MGRGPTGRLKEHMGMEPLTTAKRGQKAQYKQTGQKTHKPKSLNNAWAILSVEYSRITATWIS